MHHFARNDPFMLAGWANMNENIGIYVMFIGQHFGFCEIVDGIRIWFSYLFGAVERAVCSRLGFIRMLRWFPSHEKYSIAINRSYLDPDKSVIDMKLIDIADKWIDYLVIDIRKNFVRMNWFSAGVWTIRVGNNNKYKVFVIRSNKVTMIFSATWIPCQWTDLVVHVHIWLVTLFQPRHFDHNIHEMINENRTAKSRKKTFFFIVKRNLRYPST